MTAPAEPPTGRPRRLRRPTSTTSFGSSRRESHDAGGFYDRFVPPALSPDAEVARTTPVDHIWHASATDMHQVTTGSVALVVTSPPYFAGKAYEQALGERGIPGSYFEYLAMLRAVLAECARVLEPGGRMAVNVANLGRKPYRSLAGDVTTIMSDLGLLLRGEVVWWKGRAAGGSCAWGTYAQPRNPVLRDVTERIVIAGKGRFDRALTVPQRRAAGLPWEATVTREEFVEATTDLWELPPESATRVGHPAPFPVSLPGRLIDLHTYVGDVVLDPFVGSGTTAVAAVERGRHYLGFDTDADYVEAARHRVAGARRLVPGGPDTVAEVARALVGGAGFGDLRQAVRPRGAGIEVDLVATDASGRDWGFDVSGAFSAGGAGLRRGDGLWRAIGTASVWHESTGGAPFALITSALPTAGSPGARALAAVTGPGRPVAGALGVTDPAAAGTLAAWASAGPAA